MKSRICLALLALTLSVSPLLAAGAGKSCDPKAGNCCKAESCCDSKSCTDQSSCCGTSCSKDKACTHAKSNNACAKACAKGCSRNAHG